jgi:D-3-phosphoglycerate dehydrogenase / 2-oxoglutarate reductase
MKEVLGMKVLVTDYAWRDLEMERAILNKIGATLVVAKHGSEDELEGLAGDVDGILTSWKPVTERVIRAAPELKSIGRYGVGLDNIDVRYATNAGIVVTNVPTYCLDEVSEHAMALLLSLARKVTFFDRAIKRGKYDLEAETPMFRMKGKTLGILGYGRIGRRMAQKAEAFGLRVMVFNRSGKAESTSDVEYGNLFDVLRQSDFVSAHLPLTDETRHLLNYEAFGQMKPSAFLINTSRGAVVDSAGLLRALNEGRIAGAGLDVFEQEPPSASDPLLLHPRVIATPHAAFVSEESLEDLRTTAANQMAKLLLGEIPEFVVNPQVLTQANLKISRKGSMPPAARA